jgi:hypothetical protein
MFNAIVNMNPVAPLKLRLLAPALMTLLALCAPDLFAQAPGPAGSSAAMNAALLKLFGSNNAFTAKAEFHVTDKAGVETDTVPMTFLFLEGRLRMDIDMNQVKSASMPASFVPTLRQFGMDQSTVISRPDRKLVLSIYPRAKSYAEIPMPKEELAAIEKNFKVDKTSLGKETANGHPCEKFKVILTGDRGEKTETTVWTASDLKDFPVQVQLTEADTTVVIKFKEVKLAKPDAKEFEAPAGLTKYESAEALRDAMVLKNQGTTGARK